MKKGYVVADRFLNIFRSAPSALTLADAARDRGEWDKAISLYSQAMKENPNRIDILVQYGHSLKESGLLVEAEAAYRQAVARDGTVADYHLQLGHALKLLGRLDDAVDSYRAAFELDRESIPVLSELVALDADFQHANRDKLTARGEVVAVDLSDLFFYLRHHATLSGIQRVQVGLASALIAMKSSTKLEFRYIVDRAPIGYIELREVAIHRLVGELSRKDVSHNRIIKIIEEEYSAGKAFGLRAGDSVVVLGAFWVIENAVARYVALRRSGVKIVVLIHDIIPITHPEFCESSLTDTFNSFCVHVLQIANLILTVSDYSRETVAKYLSTRGIAAPPIKTLRSAHNTWASKGGVERPPSLEVQDILQRPFALYVSTIEVRKNHTLLFRVWKELIERHGESAIPTLVFVGRPGWRVRDLMDQLESTAFLDGKIKIIHGLSDDDLARLYKGALFSAMPSFVEGWGLPIGESLIHGTPCIASNTSSMPEVGGDYVTYVDPYNVTDAMSSFERMILDSKFRENQQIRIKKQFVSRTWSDVAEDLVEFMRGVSAQRAESSPNLAVPKLMPGKIYDIGHGDNMRRYIRSGLGEFIYFMLDTGWGAVENFGAWQLDRKASLRFATEQSSEGKAHLVMLIDTVPWVSKSSQLEILVNDTKLERCELAPGETSIIKVKFAFAAGAVDVKFNILGEIARGDDPRPLTYGIRAIGYAAEKDLAARVDLMESILGRRASIISLENSTGH